MNQCRKTEDVIRAIIKIPKQIAAALESRTAELSLCVFCVVSIGRVY
jgi:hypothetical protein